MNAMGYSIGIDEAGRGSWAGPVVAGAFCPFGDFDFSVLVGLTDSKKLTHLAREKLYILIEQEAKNGRCIFAVGSSDADTIDRVGIREANRLAMQEAIHLIRSELFLQGITLDNSLTDIQIDGRDNYRFIGVPDTKIRYIIRGDMTEPIISAASIIAKVTRDRWMCDFSLKYRDYEFHLHKGYGTRKHHHALLTYGITPLHRKSYAPVKRLISDNS